MTPKSYVVKDFLGAIPPFLRGLLSYLFPPLSRHLRSASFAALAPKLDGGLVLAFFVILFLGLARRNLHDAHGVADHVGWALLPLRPLGILAGLPAKAIQLLPYVLAVQLLPCRWQIFFPSKMSLDGKPIRELSSSRQLGSAAADIFPLFLLAHAAHGPPPMLPAKHRAWRRPVVG